MLCRNFPGASPTQLVESALKPTNTQWSRLSFSEKQGDINWFAECCDCPCQTAEDHSGTNSDYFLFVLQALFVGNVLASRHLPRQNHLLTHVGMLATALRTSSAVSHAQTLLTAERSASFRSPRWTRSNSARAWLNTSLKRTLSEQSGLWNLSLILLGCRHAREHPDHKVATQSLQNRNDLQKATRLSPCHHIAGTVHIKSKSSFLILRMTTVENMQRGTTCSNPNNLSANEPFLSKLLLSFGSLSIGLLLMQRGGIFPFTLLKTLTLAILAFVELVQLSLHLPRTKKTRKMVLI